MARDEGDLATVLAGARAGAPGGGGGLAHETASSHGAAINAIRPDQALRGQGAK